MNGSGQNLMVETPNLAIKTMPSPVLAREVPQLGAFASLRLHWPESDSGAWQLLYAGDCDSPTKQERQELRAFPSVTFRGALNLNLHVVASYAT